MDDNAAMVSLAENLWEYIKPKVSAMLANTIRFQRAKVTANPGNGTLTVKRPFCDAVTIPCVQSMENAAVNSQVLIYIHGGTAAQNSVVVGYDRPNF